MACTHVYRLEPVAQTKIQVGSNAGYICELPQGLLCLLQKINSRCDIGVPAKRRVAAVERLPVLYHSADYIVWGGVCTKSPPSRQETPRTTIQFHLQIYRWCIVSEKHKICRVFRIHLSTWTWNKGNNGDFSLLLILGLLSLHRIGKLTTRLYDKRDDFNFPIVNFPFLSSNIPSAPAYGVYVSQLIRYARTCSNYQDFMERGKVLTQKLLSQGYQKTKLVATLKKFYGRHHDLVNPYNVAVSRIVSDVFASDAP